MSYYLLVEKTQSHGWAIQFGDKDKSIVEEERANWSISSGIPKKYLKVVKSVSMRHRDCQAAVDALNAKEG